QRLVPVPLPTGPGPLGHAPEHAGVARRGRRGRAGGTLLAARLGRRRGDAPPVAAPPLPPGPPGPSGAPPPPPPSALPRPAPLSPRAAAPLRGAVRAAPDRFPPSEGAPAPPAAAPEPAWDSGAPVRRTGRVPAAVRPPGGGVLDRRRLRANGAAGAGDRLPG